METFQVDSCIQRYHTGEELNCVRERTNTEDPYAVAAIRRCAVVGHVPRNMSAACALFLRRRETIRHDQLRIVLFNTRVTELELHGPGQARLRSLRHVLLLVRI